MLGSLGKAISRRPRTMVLALVLFLLVGAGGFYGYALFQWHAAQKAVKEGRVEQARRCLRLCLWLWPRDANVHFLAARAARLGGDFEEAQAHLHRCLELQRGATAAVQLEFLLLRVQTGEVDELAPSLIAAVEQGHPDTPLILETLTQAYVRRLRYREAHACASRWIEETPDAARPYQWRGFVLERMNEPRAAMKDYEAALERDPGTLPVRLRVAEMCLEDNQVDKAVPRLEQLAKEFPDHPHVMARLGQCRYLQNRPEEARRLLEAAVKELPRDFEVLIHLARLEMQDDRPARAEYWLRRGLEVDPADVATHYALVRALHLQGRKEDAAAALAQYKKYSSWLEESNKLLAEEAKQPTTGPERPYEIGIRLLRLGQTQLGLHWLNEALARAPGHTPTLDALAEYRKKSGNAER